MKREESFDLLKAYIKNEGRFSVLIYGDRGTGKSYSVEKALEYLISESDEYSCLNGIMTINAFLIESTVESWTKILEDVNGKILIIEDIEDLDRRNQELLFQILSTKDGKFGFIKKEFKFRPVFISSYNINILKKKLENKFFDRISQLVVKFPSFKDNNITIWNDFMSTWNKMKFEGEIPDSGLKNWLETSACDILEGNFRDLDKIAINWNNYRMMNDNNTIVEKEIFQKIRESFKSTLSYPKHKKDESNTFYFSREDKGSKTAEQRFKYEYKKWIIREFDSLKIGCAKLNLNIRTVEGWTKK